MNQLKTRLKPQEKQIKQAVNALASSAHYKIRLHVLVTYLKKLRHKSNCEVSKKYCTKLIERLTNAEIQKQRLYDSNNRRIA